MAVFIAPTFGVGYQSFTNGGVVNAGGFIDQFQAGTTTVTSVYTTSLGTVAHAQPIVLDSAGRIPAGGEMWFLAGVAMKLVVKDSTSSAIQTIDNIYGVNDPTSINNLGPAGATVSSTLTMNGAAINEAQGANIPVAATVNLATATGNYIAFTGTGTVTSITVSQGAYREVVITNTAAFANSTTLLMLGGASVTVAPGDVLGFRGEASNVVRNVMLSGSAIGQQFGKVTAGVVFAGPTSGPVAFPTFKTLTQPTRTTVTSGTAQTYTVPSGAVRINVRMIGGGGGGGAAAANGGANGTDTTFSTLTAGKGFGGGAGQTAGGAGGTATNGDIVIPGGSGQGGSINSATANPPGGNGGNSAFGGGGGGGQTAVAGMNAGANSGGGGGGGGGTAGPVSSGAGGGAGAYCEKLIVSPAATYTYTVGGGGNGGAAGTSAGGNGAAGIIVIDEYYY